MGNRIYAYTVVGKDTEPWERAHGDLLVRGQGLIKVGQTTKGTARARIKQQLGTAYPGLKGVQICPHTIPDPAIRVGYSCFWSLSCRWDQNSAEFRTGLKSGEKK